MIRTLNDKDSVDGLFLVREKNIGSGKNGRAFMSLVLGDSSGSIDARLWDNVDVMAKEFEQGDVIRVKGIVQLYQNRKQIILHRIEHVDQNTIRREDYIPQSSLNTADLYLELLNDAREMKNASLQQLVLNTLEDPKIKEKLLKAPAAKSIHHAWMGGLLEHIVSICRILKPIANHYTFLNRDLLIFGAIFHDIGKIWELSWENGIAYTDRGRLVGHMEMACELIDQKSSRILGFDADLRDICKHIVLSHHGKLEYGSPKRPKFLEAMIVAMVDDMDSKITTVKSLIENEQTNSVDRWSRYSDLFDRYFLLDNMKEKFE